MSTYTINMTSTGWTVVVDGKLRGARLSSQRDAEHIGKLYTDPEYKRLHTYITESPGRAIEDIRTHRRRKKPSHYARMGRQILQYTRGRGRVGRDADAETFPLSWEYNKAFFGDSWKEELMSRLKAVQRHFKEIEDEEAKNIVYQMALALRHRDKERYDSFLGDLTLLYGEYY